MSNPAATTSPDPAVTALDASAFAAALAADKPLLVDFWATWCGPCRMMSPVVEKLAAERSDTVAVASLDVDAEPEVAQRYMVMSIPSLILFKAGKPAAKLVGFPHTGLAGVREWLDKALTA